LSVNHLSYYSGLYLKSKDHKLIKSYGICLTNKYATH
jgi:hypothetical protein